MLCVTGGPAVARAALAAKKKSVVAGPGNPPVVVDETADLENATKSIVAGAAYDNNLLCIGEKEVFAVSSIFDKLMDAMSASAERYRRLKIWKTSPVIEPAAMEKFQDILVQGHVLEPAKRVKFQDLVVTEFFNKTK